MKNRSAHTVFPHAALLTSLLLCGCASSPNARLYLLRQDRPQSRRAESAPLIVVGPLDLAEYLNRPQIVIRESRTEIRQAQFDRWAEPLDKQIQLYLKDSLASTLEDFTVESFPWRGRQSPLYEVSLSIVTLDGTPGGTAELVADWQIRRSGENARVLRSERTTLSVTCPEPGMPGLVAAVEELLAALSDTLAAALKQL